MPSVPPTEGKGRWIRVAISRAMKAACKAAEIAPPVVFHDLRRSYGSLLINAGAAVESIQGLLGHADTRMTKRAYAHLLDETLLRYDRREHRLRQARAGRGDHRRGPARGPTSSFSACPTATTRSGERAKRSRAGSGSGSRSPGHPDRPHDLDPRRGDLVGRYRDRARDPGGTRQPDPGPDDDRHRPPASARSAAPTGSSCWNGAGSPRWATRTTCSRVPVPSPGSIASSSCQGAGVVSFVRTR